MEQHAFHVACPYCGETVEVLVEPDVDGDWVQDCEVCCNPWQVRVAGEGRRRRIVVSRSDGGDL
jgi:hypothetical protein